MSNAQVGSELRYFLAQDIDLALRVKILRSEIPWAPHAHPADPFTSILQASPAAHRSTHAPPGDLMVTCQLFCDGDPVGPPLSTPFSGGGVVQGGGSLADNESEGAAGGLSDAARAEDGGPPGAGPGAGLGDGGDGDGSAAGLADEESEGGVLTSGFEWWLRFPVKLSSLPVSTTLGFTVWAPHSPLRRVALGGSTLALFGKNRILRRGTHRLKLWPGRVAAPDTPSRVPAAESRLGLLEKLIKRYERGDMLKVDWLDRVTIRQIERDNQASAAGTGAHLIVEFPKTEFPIVHQPGALVTRTLNIPAPGPVPRYPSITLPPPPLGSGGAGVGGASAALSVAVATQGGRDDGSAEAAAATGEGGAPGTHVPGDSRHPGDGNGRDGRERQGQLQGRRQRQFPFRHVVDPEHRLEPPVERKRMCLSHGLRRGLVDRGLKPNGAERNKIMEILSRPPTTPLLADQRDLLWRYRYTLVRERRALTKFLLSVEWSDKSEAREAEGLLAEWAEIDVDDALVLLSCLFTERCVRAFAVERLDKAEDDELLSYLLQLVQAIRYEPLDPSVPPSDDGAVDDPDGSAAGAADAVPPSLSSSLSSSIAHSADGTRGAGVGQEKRGGDIVSRSPLVAFLLRRACRNPTLGNFVFWYLSVETDEALAGPADGGSGRDRGRDRRGGGGGGGGGGADAFREAVDLARAAARDAAGTYMEVLAAFKAAFFGGNAEVEREVGKQLELMQHLHDVHREVRAAKGENKAKRIERLRSLLHSRDSDPSLGPVPFPLRIPLDPSITVTSFIPDTARIFTSALKPLGIQFRTSQGPAAQLAGTLPPSSSSSSSSSSLESSRSGTVWSSARDSSAGTDTVESASRAGTFGVIFKSGDDLRQDQLIIQLISLMDRLLKKEHLDLCLTPYGVLATSATAGLVEFVSDCMPISEVISEFKGDGHLLGYFRKHHPDADAPHGIAPHVLKNFKKSAAGYCVITYLLAVGDRHLDNLMLTKDGRLFHIDFSFILGRDPKPLPPPMKICKEMVDALDGFQSGTYAEFKTLCCEAYNILRKSSNLIISLFVLMADARIPDIAGDIDTTVRKLIDRFRPDLTDEEAVQFFQERIAESATALAPQVMEKFHQVAQYLRQ